MGIKIENPGGGGSGTTNHAALSNLDYASAAHTGFEASIATGTTAQFLRGDKTFALVPDTGGGASVAYAPTGATYIVQIPSATLTNEQALADLNTGILKSTSGTGIVSIASSASDYQVWIPTGTTAQFYRGDKSWQVPPGASGNSMTRAITQTSHGLAVGNVLTLDNSGNYIKAQSNTATNAEVIGIVSVVTDVDTFTLVMGGYISSLSNLTVNNAYYLSATTAGALTLTEPTTAGQISKPVLVSISATEGYVFNFRGNLIPGATAGNAPASATYIVQTVNATLTNEQAIADLNTGILKGTSGTGLVSIAVAGTDFEAPIATGTTAQFYRGDKSWQLVPDTGGGGTIYAPTGATYIVQIASATLTNEQALADLSTGLVYVTSGTGVLTNPASFSITGTATCPTVIATTLVSTTTLTVGTTGTILTLKSTETVSATTLTANIATIATTITSVTIKSTETTSTTTLTANVATITTTVTSATVKSTETVSGVNITANVVTVNTTITSVTVKSTETISATTLTANKIIVATNITTSSLNVTSLDTGIVKVTTSTGLIESISTGTTAQYLRGDMSWQLVPDTGAGSGTIYAPTGATYIVQIASATLSNEQALADLDTGLLKVTSGTGILTTASSSTDYQIFISTGTAAQLYLGSKTFGLAGDTSVATNADLLLSTVGITIDGAGSVLTTGVKGFIEVPYNSTIVKGSILCTDTSPPTSAGSFQVDIWKNSAFPPAAANTITSNTPLFLSTGTNFADSTLSGWTTTVTAGDFIGFNVQTSTGLKRATVALKLRKT